MEQHINLTVKNPVAVPISLHIMSRILREDPQARLGIIIMKGGNMYKINFERPQNIHFIGIGGISMSGLAEVLLDEGFSVSGSDSAD